MLAFCSVKQIMQQQLLYQQQLQLPQQPHIEENHQLLNHVRANSQIFFCQTRLNCTTFLGSAIIFNVGNFQVIYIHRTQHGCCLYTLPKNKLICPKNMGAQVAMNFSQNEGLAPKAIEKIKIQGTVLELPANLHNKFSPFGPITC